MKHHREGTYGELAARSVKCAGFFKSHTVLVPAALSNISHVAMTIENFTAPANFAEQYSNNVSTFDCIMEAVATALNTYYTPLLTIFGSIGNLISIFVFYTSKLRLQSTSLYLSALALSDTVFLLQLMPPWLNAVHITSFFHRDFFCQLIVYSSYVTCFLSAWLVVAFTIERFVAVLYPLQRNSMCTMARAKFVIAALVVTALGLNIPIIKFASPSTNDCNIDYDYLVHAARFNILDTAVSFTVPLAIIFILNTWIMVGVYRLECARHALVKAEQQAGTTRAPQPPDPGRARPLLPPLPRSQRRVTRMLLLVSTVYIVLNVPAYTMRILAYALNMSSKEYSGRWAALQQLALTFFNTNFGINFFLYCLSGQNFRRALCQSIPCLRRRYVRGDTLRMTSRNVQKDQRESRASSVSTSMASATEASLMTHSTMLVKEEAPGNVRRHRSEPFIERWTFGKNRVQRAPDQSAEPSEETLTNTADLDKDRATAQCPDELNQMEVPEYRRIPFVLFPYRNLIVPRSSRCGSAKSGSRRGSQAGGE